MATNSDMRSSRNLKLKRLNSGGKGSTLPRYLISFYLLVVELKQPKFKLLNFFSQFLEYIIQKEEAKVKKFFQNIPQVKRKNLWGWRRSISGGRTGSQCQELFADLPKLSRIIYSLVTPCGVYLLQRLACPPQVHLIQESTWQPRSECGIIGARGKLSICTSVSHFGAGPISFALRFCT